MFIVSSCPKETADDLVAIKSNIKGKPERHKVLLCHAHGHVKMKNSKSNPKSDEAQMCCTSILSVFCEYYDPTNTGVE